MLEHFYRLSIAKNQRGKKQENRESSQRQPLKALQYLETMERRKGNKSNLPSAA